MSLYLDLLRQVLTRSLFIDEPEWKRQRLVGLDHPVYCADRDLRPFVNAETMIGDVRLRNVQDCANCTLSNDIPGDFMECGVWRGGAAIFMRAILKDIIAGWNWRGEGRTVWLADSFAGLPKPNAEAYPADAGDQHHAVDYLAVSLDEVKRNFARYGLLDERVKFLPGFFKDTLPGPVKQLALLRIDADMYEGVTQALEAMYPLVSPGGFVIIDDYQNIPQTRKAVDDFLERHELKVTLTPVDWCAVWWRKN